MTAYWVNVYREISDQDKMAAYAALAFPALTGAGGRFIARGMPEAYFEAGQAERVVLIEFDSVEAAVAAHNSPEYAKALAALDGAAVRDLRIVPAAE